MLLGVFEKNMDRIEARLKRSEDPMFLGAKFKKYEYGQLKTLIRKIVIICLLTT